MPITLVKRVLSLVLIAAGLDNQNIHRLTGYGDSTIRKLRSDMRKKSISEFLVIRGGGRKAKSDGIENDILNELEINRLKSQVQNPDNYK